jgi:hypothetical protein
MPPHHNLFIGMPVVVLVLQVDGGSHHPATEAVRYQFTRGRIVDCDKMKYSSFNRYKVQFDPDQSGTGTGTSAWFSGSAIRPDADRLRADRIESLLGD